MSFTRKRSSSWRIDDFYSGAIALSTPDDLVPAISFPRVSWHDFLYCLKSIAARLSWTLSGSDVGRIGVECGS